MRTLSALIIDDEERARRSLAALLDQFCDGVEVIGLAASVTEGLAALSDHPADVVFLDVSMPERDGFALAARPELADQAIVFVTAHADYALEAFRVNAVDYLLKPVNVEQLRASLERVRHLRGDEQAGRRPTLRFYAKGEHRVLPLSDILYLEADGAYTYIQTDTQRHMVSKGLKELSEGLVARRFFRTHRSYLVNLDHVAQVRSLADGSLLLDTGREVPLSRYRRAELLRVV